MSVEPALSRARLLEGLFLAYGLDLARLTFLPHGTAPAYRAEGASGRFFVKVTRRPPAEAPLLRALRPFLNVPRVRPATSGDVFAVVEGHVLFVCDLIDGVNLGNEWDAALPELAALLGRLHSATPRLSATLPVAPEAFDLPFEPQLRADLRLLRTRPGALRDLVSPVEPEVRRALSRARSVRARPRDVDFVVCHTDAHGANVMRDAAGDLWLVDWENARLAPPEHDLWMLRARLPEVLEAYGRDFTPNPDLMSFYLYRRVLEDLAVDVRGVMAGDASQEQEAEHLRILREFVLPALARVEDEAERLRAL